VNRKWSDEISIYDSRFTIYGISVASSV
jgi:hypothetical protein